MLLGGNPVKFGHWAKTLLFMVTLGCVAPLTAQAVSDTPIDQSKPVATWCTPALFACDGYAALSDEQYLPPWTPAYKNVQGYYHNDLNGIYGMPSYAVAITRNEQGDATSVVGCTDIASPTCVGTEVRFRANLPICSSQISIDCMRDIVVIDKQGKFVINPQFDQALSFSEGLAVVEVGGRWGYISR